MAPAIILDGGIFIEPFTWPSLYSIGSRTSTIMRSMIFSFKQDSAAMTILVHQNESYKK